MRKLLAISSTAVVALIALMGLASNVAAQTVSGSAAAGEKKAAMCIGCHSIPGYQASFPEVHKVPMIAGRTPSTCKARSMPTRPVTASTRR